MNYIIKPCILCGKEIVSVISTTASETSYQVKQLCPECGEKYYTVLLDPIASSKNTPYFIEK